MSWRGSRSFIKGYRGAWEPPVMIAGTTYTTAQLQARVQTSLDAETQVLTAETELNDARASCERVRKSERGFLLTLASLMKSQYGDSELPLAELGLRPKKKPGKRTNEQRLVMSAKNRATRQERGTMSKKQKKAIKGNVTGVVITPIVRKGTDEDEK
jgi:hypothetical protein